MKKQILFVIIIISILLLSGCLNQKQTPVNEQNFVGYWTTQFYGNLSHEDEWSMLNNSSNYFAFWSEFTFFDNNTVTIANRYDYTLRYNWSIENGYLVISDNNYNVHLTYNFISKDNLELKKGEYEPFILTRHGGN